VTDRTSVQGSAVTGARRLERSTGKHATRNAKLEKQYVPSTCAYGSILTNRSQGSKIRTTYIAFAQKEKKRLEALVLASEQEITVREKEVVRLKGISRPTQIVMQNLIITESRCRAS